MMNIEKLLSEGLLRSFKGGRITDADVSEQPLVVLAPRKTSIEVATQLPVRLVVVHEQNATSAVDVRLMAGAQLSLTDIYPSASYASTTVQQAEGSACRVVCVLMGGAHVEYRTLLDEPHAECDIFATFVASGADRCAVSLDTRHNASDCRSNSLVKGVAAGRATGEFRGLVYVAQDAQRTDAAQLNRNVELGQAHIVTMPQLEIYADDVKCSHGTTVGRLDEEAVYYMQQRGIGRSEAERLQIEGFVNDVISKCDTEWLREQLASEMAVKLEQL